MSNIRATSFVDASSNTGLNTPAMTVSVKFDQNRKEERVNFGLVGSDAFFARPGDSTAGKIDALELNEALKALDEISK